MSDTHAGHGDDHSAHDGHEEAHAESHGHEEAQAKAAPTSGAAACKCDPFFDKVSNYVTGKIATFVAFLFFLITIGAVYALVITKAPLDSLTTVLILAPAAVGLLAYWNRDLAVIIFVVFIISFLII